MAKIVIKSDGSKIPFDAKKITRGVTRAAQDAKLDPKEINNLAGEITNNVMVFAETKDKLKSSEIKDLILSDLDRIAPIVAAEWRKFINTRRK